MTLNKKRMLDIVRRELAFDMNCDPEDFLRDGVVFCEAVPDKGIWIDERQTPHLKAVTMGRGIAVCADKELLPKVRPILENKDRDDLFSAPFFYGQGLQYIPDSGQVEELPCPKGFELHVAEGEDVFKLYTVPGFEHALRYDRHYPRPDVLVVYAAQGNEIAGMAGACIDCKTMWQIGIDVKPGFRGAGLAACLVSRLTAMILKRDIVPFYATSTANIPSQSVAHRSGFAPAWMCSYMHSFDEKSSYEGEVKVTLGHA